MRVSRALNLFSPPPLFFRSPNGLDLENSWNLWVRWQLQFYPVFDPRGLLLVLLEMITYLPIHR